MLENYLTRLKINHLRLIVAIADHGRITVAAEILNITQPAASRLLGEMEQVLNAKLYKRHPKGVELTLIGRALAKRARAVLIEMRDIFRDVEELKTGKGGIARVGAVTGAALGYLVPAIQQLKAVSPGIEVHVSVSTSNTLVEELQSGKHDFVLARVPSVMDANDFDIFRARSEKIDLIVREDHPLSALQTVFMSNLTHYEWVLQPTGTPIREIIEMAFLETEEPFPEKIVNTTSLLVTLAILANSTAIAPIAREVSELLAGNNIGAKIQSLPLDREIEIRPYSLITLKGRELSPTANRLKKLVLLDLETTGKTSEENSIL
ncbi:MAG: LysR family transcriptional regulator [Methyloligellaceae bacterium]